MVRFYVYRPYVRYKYGMFYQKIIDKKQAEFPDYWLVHGNPWEVERQDITYKIHFGGNLTEYVDEFGRPRVTQTNYLVLRT